MLHTRITPPTLFLENKLMGGWQRGGDFSFYFLLFARGNRKKAKKYHPFSGMIKISDMYL
ncbi:hypothetical protein ACWCKO_29360, partial [Bacillus thuringiensis serovar darmstadiensis]